MKRGDFIYNGVNSSDLNLFIQSRPLINAPLRRVEFRQGYGANGSIPFDEEAYDNTSLDLLMLVDGDDLIGDRQEVYDLLDSRGVYAEMIPYFDSEKIYRVMLEDVVKFENRFHYGERQTLQAKFTVKPYKYYIESEAETLVNKRLTITNPTKYHSQPLIRITGSGAITIKVNGLDFKLNNVPGDIVVDGERYSSYRESPQGILTPMNDKVFSREYPVLRPGINEIEVTGDVTEVIVEPRWRSLV